MIFVGVDWAEARNDVLVMDEGGVVLGRGRFSAGGWVGSPSCTRSWPITPRSQAR